MRPAPRSLLIAAGASAAVAALCIVAVDRPLVRWVAGYEASAVWDRGIELLEWTLGLPVWRFLSSFALVAGMLAAMLVPRWRPHAPAWMVVAGTHVIGRFATGQLKDATGRLRPTEWLERGGDTFFRDGVAFPSGHVVLFASIVIPLAILAPRTRPLLAIVAFVMVARIAVGAHYPSDAIAAITVVSLLAWVLTALARPRRTA